jgi:hypothetical protein
MCHKSFHTAKIRNFAWIEKFSEHFFQHFFNEKAKNVFFKKNSQKSCNVPKNIRTFAQIINTPMKRTNHAGIIGPTICNVVFGLYGGRVCGMFGAEGVCAK